LAVYRGVREYRDRFPDKPIIAWHGGAGPIPVLMAGGAQALMRNPAAGQSQGGARDDAAFNRWVRGELAGVLMRMTPRDGWLADAEQNWCLADDAGEHLLIYSLAGESIRFVSPLPQARYRAEWFNPRNGEVGEATSGSVIAKPDAQAWLLRLWVER
jgi:hypothetical protein